jgi:flagellar protein FliS
MTQQGLNAYRRTEVQSRTPLELVVMLYDGALRFVTASRDAMARRDIRARREATSRLLAIMSELQSTLDMQRGGEVATTLDALYDYMTERITTAAVKNDAAPLDEVQRLLEMLRDAWQTIAQTTSVDPVVASGTVSSAGALPLGRAR